MTAAPPPGQDSTAPDESPDGEPPGGGPADDKPDAGPPALFGRGAPPSPGLAMLADLMNNHLDPGYAAAAERRRAGFRPSRRNRRTRSALTVACAVIIGLVLAVAYRETVATAPDAARTRAALLKDVKNRQNRGDALQKQVDTLRKDVGDAQDAAVADTTSGRSLSESVRDAEAISGLRPVRGPGVVLVVADGKRAVDPVTGRPLDTDDEGLVHDFDLQNLVNALWWAGAEAIAVDGQRLTAYSAIRAAGGAIQVDQRPVDNPYTITAVGPQDQLYRRFLRSATVTRFQSVVREFGIGIDLRRTDDQTIPAGIVQLPSVAPSPSRSSRVGTPAVPPATAKPSTARPGPTPSASRTPSPALRPR